MNMRIDPRWTKIVSTEKTENPKVNFSQGEEKGTAKKVVNLSGDTLLVKKATEHINAHEAKGSEKVSRLKAEIESGNYKVDEEKLANILEKLL